jgi:isopentenyldiphosphate isomerase
MKNPDPEELFPVVDEDGNTSGEALRSVCHDGKSMLLHPVVHLHLFNSSDELFMQKRAMSKDIQPGKWDTSVGGHLDLGETVEEALAREAYEELGLTDFEPVFLGKYVWESSRERELVSSFSTKTDYVPLINKDEIDEGKYWSIKDIKENIGKNVFTPNFEHEFRIIVLPTTLLPHGGC